MSRSSQILRYVAFAMMAAFGLIGGLFVIGETVADPGGWTAVLMTALWLLPLAALSAFALMRPAAAGPPFVGITAVVVAFTLTDAAFHLVPRDDWGPVAAVVVFALGVALAFLGLHRARLAGTLMVVAGLAQFAATLIVREGSSGPGVGAMLGGSSGVVIMPIVVVGALFLLSDSLARQPMNPRIPPRVRPTH